MKWTKGKYSIAVAMPDGQGEGVGVRHGYLNGPFAIEPKTWTVTHAPSGMKVCSARSFTAAKELVAKLLPLLDWTQEDPLKGIGEQKRMKIRLIVAARGD